MMRIGVVRRGYSATGGAESYLKRFVKGLMDRGLEVVLFTASDWPEEDWPGQQIHRLQAPGGPLAFADALDAMDPWKHCDFLFSLERVWKCDCYRAGDGVHKAWLRRRTNYEWPVKSWFRQHQSKHLDLLKIEKELFRADQGTFIIANAQMVADELQREYAFPKERLTVIYNGYDPPAGKEPKQESTDTRFRILFTGSGWERKGLRYAVAATNELVRRGHDVEFLVAGRGRRKIRGKCVRYLGPVSDIGSVLRKGDLFVLPTLYDPFSNACIEALCYELPVITTTANGFSEIIENGVHGEIIKNPNNINQLAGAMERWCDRNRLAESRPRLQSLGRKYSVDANVGNTLQFFHQIS